jgi:hypothetical protein
MSNPKHPSQAMIEDLYTVFKKHNWSGELIGLQPFNSVLSAAGSDESGRVPARQNSTDHQLSTKRRHRFTNCLRLVGKRSAILGFRC